MKKFFNRKLFLKSLWYWLINITVVLVSVFFASLCWNAAEICFNFDLFAAGSLIGSACVTLFWSLVFSFADFRTRRRSAPDQEVPGDE